MSEVTGVVVAQLGTPASPSTRDVRRYLREFLSDPLVIDVPGPARWLLVNGVIAPFRAPRTAAAYRKVWRPDGSPLRVHTDAIAAALAKTLGDACPVEVGMRYGEPTLAGALDRLAGAGARRIVVATLYPQHAESSRGTALLAARSWAAARPDAPELAVLPPFFAAPGFVAAVAAATRPVLDEAKPEHVLMSYHSLPERHVLTVGSLRPEDAAFAALFADFVVEQSGGADEPIDRRVFELVDGRLVEFAGLDAAGG
jgi:ferrochelatase